MLRTIQSVFKSLKGNPLKSVLTLVTVGLGVGVLIMAMSVSTFLSEILSRELSEEGIVVTFTNGEINEEGEMERVRPPQMDANVLDVVRSDVDGVVGIAPVTGAFWNEVKVGEYTYRLRTVVASTEDYAQVMGLDAVAGTFFTAEDVEKGRRVVLLSESLAEMLFGSTERALGENIHPPARNFGGGRQREDRETVLQNFKVVGIYKDLNELKRKAYQAADLVMPFTSMLPAGANVQQMQRFMLSTLAMRVKGLDFATAEAQLRDVLSREYGDDLKLAVWEGTPQGESATIEEARQTVNVFTLVVNILGFVLLITGSIGILSIMLVEILARTKEISLERALGAAKSNIIKEYFARAITLSLLSAAIGVVLSILFARPLTQLLLPLFATMGITEAAGGVLNPFAILIGTGVALVIGGVFGVFPVFTTLKTGIAEGIREA